MTQEDIEKELQELKETLKEQGLHHATKEFKEAVEQRKAELEAQLTGGGEEETTTEKVEKPKVEEVAPKPQPKKVEEEEKSDMVIDSNKSYTFRLLKKTASTWFLPRTGRAWDDKEQRPRDIRYCKTEDSPYLDEQDEHSREERLAPIFKDGILRVSGKNKALIQYLMAHDAYAGKGGKVLTENMKFPKYELEDNSKAAKTERQFREEVRKANNVIAEANIDALENLMRSHFRFIQNEFNEDELVAKAYEKAAKHPTVFTEDFNNPKHAIKAKVQRGLHQVIFSAKQGVVRLTDSNSVVLKYDNTSKRFDDAITEWILKGSQEAKDFEKILDNRIK